MDLKYLTVNSACTHKAIYILLAKRNYIELVKKDHMLANFNVNYRIKLKEIFMKFKNNNFNKSQKYDN